MESYYILNTPKSFYIALLLVFIHSTTFYSPYENLKARIAC